MYVCLCVRVCKNALRTKELFGLFLTVLSINSTLNFQHRLGGVIKLTGFCFFRTTHSPIRPACYDRGGEGEKRARELFYTAEMITHMTSPSSYPFLYFFVKGSTEKIRASEGCGFMLSPENTRWRNFVYTRSSTRSTIRTPFFLLFFFLPFFLSSSQRLSLTLSHSLSFSLSIRRHTPKKRKKEKKREIYNF